jgi:3-hydroxyisobutyrate dehydrogenase-like beta-hydroxyacid dehydrogenase
LSEGINFAQQGSTPSACSTSSAKGRRNPGEMDNRGKTMVADKFDFGFAVDWMRKDLAICRPKRGATARRCR